MTGKFWSTWWTQRPTREKRIMQLCALVVGGALLWVLAIAPAVRSLQNFTNKYPQGQAQLALMRDLQAQAQALKAQPKLTKAAATEALQATVLQSFGTAGEVSMVGENTSVILRNVSPQALAQWLVNARTQALSTPRQAQLTRNAEGWSGTLQMNLPE